MWNFLQDIFGMREEIAPLVDRDEEYRAVLQDTHNLEKYLGIPNPKRHDEPISTRA